MTGEPQKFLMRQAMVEELGLVAQKTAWPGKRQGAAP
jgi:fatty-acyl-CoA synthase